MMPKYLVINRSKNVETKIKACNKYLPIFFITLDKETLCLHDFSFELRQILSPSFIASTSHLYIYIFLHASPFYQKEFKINLQYTIESTIGFSEFKKLFKMFPIPVTILPFTCYNLFFCELIFDLIPGSRVITLTDFTSLLTLHDDFYSSMRLDNISEILKNFYKHNNADLFCKPLPLIVKKENTGNIVFFNFGETRLLQESSLCTFYPYYYINDMVKYPMEFKAFILGLILVSKLEVNLETQQKQLLVYNNYIRVLNTFFSQMSFQIDFYNQFGYCNSELHLHSLLLNYFSNAELKFFEFSLYILMCHGDKEMSQYYSTVTKFMYQEKIQEIVRETQNFNVFYRELCCFLKDFLDQR